MPHVVHDARILQRRGFEGARPDVAGEHGRGVEYLRVVAPSWVALGAGVVLGNAMAGAGATRTTLVIDLAIIVGLQFPASIVAVAALHLGSGALFELVAITNVVGAVVYAGVFALGRWRHAMNR